MKSTELEDNVSEDLSSDLDKASNLCTKVIQTHSNSIHEGKKIIKNFTKAKEDYEKDKEYVEIIKGNPRNDKDLIQLRNVNLEVKEQILFLERFDKDSSREYKEISSMAATSSSRVDASANLHYNLFSIAKGHYSATTIPNQIEMDDNNRFFDTVEFIDSELSKINPELAKSLDYIISEWFSKEKTIEKLHLLINLRTIIFDKLIGELDPIKKINSANWSKRWNIPRHNKNEYKKVVLFILGNRVSDELSDLPDSTFSDINNIADKLSTNKHRLSELGKLRYKSIPSRKIEALLRDTIYQSSRALKLRREFLESK